MYPTRFRTGVKNTTIPNPAILEKDNGKVFQGTADAYDFEKQVDNYQRLRAVLSANNKQFHLVCAAHYPDDRGTNHRFVVTTKDGCLLWHKYVGFSAQSGQNHVFIAGRRIKVSRFLEFSSVQQSALLSGDETRIQYHFSPAELRYMDEAGTLWN